MTRVTSRYTLQAVLAICCGAFLFAASAHAESRTWNLAGEFPVKKKNPSEDKYKDKGVWSYMYGEADTPSTYTLMTHFFKPKKEEGKCHVQDFYGFGRTGSVEGTPGIWYNAGPTVERGMDRCAPYAIFPSKTAFMHPEFSRLPEFTNNAVVGWKSPVTGTVTVSGSVECVDEYVSGISWQLDQGSAVLLGPVEADEDGFRSFGPIEVSVTAGEYLYLEIGRAIGVDGAFDSTAVALTIESP
jgi:hypothetical protein